jgi:hypothetical protein
MRQGVAAARCIECAFEWRSAAMAEGLRVLGACPRCGGGLEFAGDAAPVTEEPEVQDMDPARVLGVPRRPGA